MNKRYTVAFLVLAVMSVNTFASQLNCDLKVSKTKQVPNAASETVEKSIHSTYQVFKKDFKLIGMGAQGFEIITYRENVPEKDFGHADQWEYSNCSNKTIITGECSKESDLDDKEVYRCPTTITFKCDRTPLMKKSLAEYKAELCEKATECASEIENTDDINSYIKLQETLCKK